MPKAVYQEIYADLKGSIEAGGISYGAFLPSENELTATYGCSRSSIRRAIGQLAADGYVLSQQGKGVRVIRDPSLDVTRGYEGLETFAEMAERLHFTPRTCCLALEHVTASKELSRLTGFPVGTKLTRALRSRHIEDVAVSTDESYIPSELTEGLTPDAVEKGIYHFLEGEHGLKIAMSRRIITVEAATSDDEKHIDLDRFNAVAVMRCRIFDTEGAQVEFTATRQKPGHFSQYLTVMRPQR